MEFEHTPREMAEKLMEFIRDFSTDSTDDEENRETELDCVTELFDKLQKSDEYNILAHQLDENDCDDKEYYPIELKEDRSIKPVEYVTMEDIYEKLETVAKEF